MVTWSSFLGLINVEMQRNDDDFIQGILTCPSQSFCKEENHLHVQRKVFCVLFASWIFTDNAPSILVANRDHFTPSQGQVRSMAQHRGMSATAWSSTAADCTCAGMMAAVGCLLPPLYKRMQKSVVLLLHA